MRGASGDSSPNPAPDSLGAAIERSSNHRERREHGEPSNSIEEVFPSVAEYFFMTKPRDCFKNCSRSRGLARRLRVLFRGSDSFNLLSENLPRAGGKKEGEETANASPDTDGK